MKIPHTKIADLRREVDSMIVEVTAVAAEVSIYSEDTRERSIAIVIDDIEKGQVWQDPEWRQDVMNDMDQGERAAAVRRQTLENCDNDEDRRRFKTRFDLATLRVDSERRDLLNMKHDMEERLHFLRSVADHCYWEIEAPGAAREIMKQMEENAKRKAI